MKILKNKRNNYTVTLEIETDYAEIEKAMDPAYQEIAKDVKIAGFRPGKAPRHIFEQHYGKEPLIQRASIIVMNNCYKTAIEQENLEPVDYPKNVDIKTLDPKKGFVFTLSVDVKPEVKLKRYKGLKVSKETVEVSEEEVNKEIEQLREYYAEYKTVERPIQDGDLVSYAIKAFDGENPVETLTKTDSGTKIGAAFLSKDFDDALLGAKSGESRSFSAKVKEEYFQKDLAGKTLRFEVLIKEVKERVLPEINDEFAKKVSGKTLDELKKDITEHKNKIKTIEAENKFRNNLSEELIKENEVDVPPALIEEKLQLMLKDLEHDMQHRGIDLNKYLQVINKTLDQIKEEYKPIAEKRAKLDLILEAIAKKENLKPSAEEFKAELIRIIKGNKPEEPKPEDIEKIEKNLPPSVKKQIENYLTEEKAMEFVINNAKNR